MKKNLFVFCAGLLSLFVWSCSDDDGGSIDRQLLTQSAWQLTATYGNVYVPLQEPDPFDAYTSLPDCRKDDLYHFAEDNSFRIESGDSSCPEDPANGTITTGTWSESGSNVTLDVPNGLGLEVDTFIDPVLLPPNFDWAQVVKDLLTNMKVVSLTANRMELFSQTEFVVDVNGFAVTIQIDANLAFTR